LLFGHSYQFLNLHIKKLGNLEKSVKARLDSVRAPFGDSSWILAELLGKPFVGSFLLHKYDFDSVYIFAHDVYYLFNGTKVTIFIEESPNSSHMIGLIFQ
jgi:hypothetical protein